MKVTGLTEAQESFNKIAKAANKEGLTAGRKGAKPMLEAIRSLTPRRTGNAARAVRVSNGTTKDGKVTLHIGFTGRGTNIKDAFYIQWVIGGHRIGPEELGDKRKLIPPNDFLDRAWVAAREQMADLTIKTWGDRIEKGAE